MAEEYGRKRPQRVQLACPPCRQSKLRCNRDTPVCNKCTKRSREGSCAYTERGLRYNAARQKAELMRKKLDRPESFVSQLKQSAPSEKLGKVSANEIMVPPDNGLANGDLAQAAGRLRLTDTGGVHFVGPSHWESIIKDIAEVKAYFDLQGSPENLQDDDSLPLTQSNVIAADIQLGVAQVYSKEDLLAFLPTNSVVDRLVAMLFHTADPLRLIPHPPTFQTEYQRFWQEPAAVSPGWLALLASFAGVGAEIFAQTRRDPSMFQSAEDVRRLTAHALVLADYVKPQPYIIESLLLHTKSLLFKSTDVNAKSYILLGCVTRLCTQGGYHRDPSHNPGILPLEAEMRRQIWDAVCAYDTKMCYQLGLVSVINQVTQDTAGSFELHRR